MMKNTVVAMTFVAMILAVMSQAQGTLVYWEDFGYAPSASIDGVGGWSNANNTVGVSATGLNYPGLRTQGGAANRPGGAGDSGAGNYATKNPAGVADLFNSTNSVFYQTMLIGDTQDPSNNSPHANLWIMQDNGSSYWNDDGITIDTTGGATVRVNIHKFGVGETGVSYTPTAGTKLYALRYTMKAGDDDVAFILNPDLETLADSDFDSAPTASGELTDATNALDHFIVYFAGGGTDTLLDEIRFGTTLADVIPGPVVPEPASLTLLGLSGLMMLRRRHA